LIYNNGQLNRTLTLREVFRCSRFTDRDCFMGPVVTIDSFDDDAGRVNLSAVADGKKQSATIAFRTNEVIESSGIGESFDPSPATTRNWGRAILIGLVVIGVGAVGVVGLVLLSRRQPIRNA
jgi:hypothetical protein